MTIKTVGLRLAVVAALVGAFVAASPNVVIAAGCHTPERGSAERKAIMDSLRKPVTKELGQSVIFVISDLKVCGNWAFLAAEPKLADGHPVDWSLGIYADAVADDMCGGFVHALLIKKGGHWQVREHVVCATDVPWVTWPDDFGAPAALFPQF